MTAHVPTVGQHPGDKPLVAAKKPAGYVSAMAEPGLVHIIDDDLAVRKGLASLVRSVGNDARLYGSTSEFLDDDLPAVPSCIILDLEVSRA
jgi:hypothetical protein